MNYRHHYHAGNFADVAKHILVLALIEGLKRKEKGLLYLDTHAGRGGYDLAGADRGDRLEREPEWPGGWGRIERAPDAPQLVENYVATVRAFAAEAEAKGVRRAYPGSPALALARLRAQDRALLCEYHPEEFDALVENLGETKRTRVENRDGYEAIRGALPPLERRALVLIDPPYESAGESDQVAAALREGLRRLPGGTFAVWYPITERVGRPSFLDLAKPGAFSPTWTAELTVAGPEAGLKMRGAGVMVVNPPWRLDEQVAPTMAWLGDVLAQAPGGQGELRWLVPE